MSRQEFGAVDTRSLSPVGMQGWKLKVKKESYWTLLACGASNSVDSLAKHAAARACPLPNPKVTLQSPWRQSVRAHEICELRPALSFSWHGKGPRILSEELVEVRAKPLLRLLPP